MCQDRQCPLANPDPAAWNKACLVPPAPWLPEELERFQRLVAQLARGQDDAARAILRDLRNDDLHAWFDEHGKSKRLRRLRLAAAESPTDASPTTPTLKASKKHQRTVYARDRYTCRWCGLRVVDERILKIVSQILPAFGYDRTAPNRHGFVKAFKPVADHVQPATRGGHNEVSNLVTCCSVCNYGRMERTHAELGLEDPRNRQPADSEWNGLVSYLNPLQARLDGMS